MCARDQRFSLRSSGSRLTIDFFRAYQTLADARFTRLDQTRKRPEQQPPERGREDNKVYAVPDERSQVEMQVVKNTLHGFLSIWPPQIAQFRHVRERSQWPEKRVREPRRSSPE